MNVHSLLVSYSAIYINFHEISQHILPLSWIIFIVKQGKYFLICGKLLKSNRLGQILPKYLMLYIILLIMVRIIDNYTLYEVIGQGNYGRVYRAINKDDNKEYAVKVIESRMFKADKKLEHYTINEINILTNIQSSPHIIRYHGMLKSTNNFYFIYEYCNNGTLAELIQRKKYIKENQALKILRQLLQAFKVLKRNHVMHRDLKPDNIFFSDQTVKLGDFGFCKNLGESTVTKTMLGSPVYMAPEVLRGQKYSDKADIWSIGVVLYQMLYGYCPFQSTNISKLIHVIDTCQVCFQETINVSPETKQLINKLLTKDVKNRIGWNELFQIKINQQGQYVRKVVQITQKLSSRLLNSARSLNTMTGVRSYSKRPQTSQNSNAFPNFLRREKSPSVLDKRIKTQYKEQQNMNDQKNISLKFPTIQQDTDDESLKTKFMRKKQNKSGNIEKPLFLQKHHTTNDQVRVVYCKPTLLGKQLNSSKIAVSNEHKEITKGLTISKLFATSGLRHSRLFTQLILTEVKERLINLKIKNQQLSIAPELINLISAQLETIQRQLEEMQKHNQQNTELINLHKENYISILKEKVPQCKHPKLCYQMVCYLLRLPMQRLCTEQIKEKIKQILN